MLVLLPPSESKSSRYRGRPADPATLSWPELGPARAEVARALGQVSAAPDACEVLAVSPALAAEVARNTVLASAPAVPVAQLYTGVLYDALDLPSLDSASRRRAGRRLVVVSALHGALRLSDRVAPYRLSMGVSLPGVGPLAAHWRPHLDAPLTAAAGRGLVVDCRSSTYAAAWRPRGPLAERWVRVAVPGASHGAKHTRGLVARELCRATTDPRDPHALLSLLGDGLEASLTEPSRPGAGWTMEVTER